MFDRYAEKLSRAETSMELIKILDSLSLSAGFSQYRLALMIPTQHLGRPHLLIFSNCNPDCATLIGLKTTDSINSPAKIQFCT